MGGIDAAAIRVVFVSASLFAVGCVSNKQAYPQAWPSLEKPVGQACAQMADITVTGGRVRPIETAARLLVGHRSRECCSAMSITCGRRIA